MIFLKCPSVRITIQAACVQMKFYVSFIFVQTLLFVDKMPAWTTQNIEDQVAA